MGGLVRAPPSTICCSWHTLRHITTAAPDLLTTGSRVTSRQPPLLPAWALVRARHSDMRAACRERTAKLMLQLPSWLTAARAGPAPAQVELCRAALQRRACVAWGVQGCSVAHERWGKVVRQGGVQDCSLADVWHAVWQPAKAPSL